MSKNRRKRQIRNRIIAFVMAVAMVFTVVKVNDSKKVVKAGAGESTGTYVDYQWDNTIKEYINAYWDGVSTPIIDFYLQNDQIEFGFPSITPSKTRNVYAYFEGEIPTVTTDTPSSPYIAYTVTDTLEVGEGNFRKTGEGDLSEWIYVLTRNVSEPTTEGTLSSEQVDQLKIQFSYTGYGYREYTEIGGKYKRQLLKLIYHATDEKKYSITNNGIEDNWESGLKDNKLYYGSNKFAVFEKVGDDKETLGVGEYNASNQVDENRVKTYATTVGYGRKSAAEVNEIIEAEENIGKTFFIVPIYDTFAVPSSDDASSNDYTYFIDVASGEAIVAGNPEITSVSYGETNLTSGGSVTTNDPTSVTATVKSGMPLETGMIELQVKDGENSWSKIEGCPVTVSTSDTDTIKNYTVSVGLSNGEGTDKTYAISEGKNTYCLVVGSEASKEFDIIYDKTAPVITGVTITQDGKEYVYAETIPEDKIGILDQANEIVFTVALTDELSGIAADRLQLFFNGKTYNGTGFIAQSGETPASCTFTIPATDLTETVDGVAREYTISAFDNAGNESTSEIKSGKLKFVDSTDPVIQNIVIEQGEGESVKSTVDADDSFTIKFDVIEANIDDLKVEIGSDINSSSEKVNAVSIGTPTDIEGGKRYIATITLGGDDKTIAQKKGSIEYKISVSDKSNRTDDETGNVSVIDEFDPIVDDVKLKQGSSIVTKVDADSEFEVQFSVYDYNISDTPPVLTIGNNSTATITPGTTSASAEYGFCKPYTATVNLSDEDKATANTTGSLSYTITARDSAGNIAEAVVGKVSGTIQFNDNSKPTVNLVSIKQGDVTCDDSTLLNSTESITFTISATDVWSGIDISTFKLTFNGKDYNAVATTTEGQYTIAIPVEDLAVTINGATRNYSINVDDIAQNHADAIVGKLKFADTTNPVIDVTSIELWQDQTVGLTGITKQTGKMVAYRDLVVRFNASDIGYMYDQSVNEGSGGDIATDIAPDTVKVSLSGGTGETAIDFTGVKAKTAILKEGGYYEVTFTGGASGDLAPAATGGVYTLTFNASDNAGNAAEPEEKEITFYNEKADITITPKFVCKDDLINGVTYANYNDSTTNPDKIRFTVVVKSETLLALSNIHTNDGYGFENLDSTGYATVDGKFVYTLEAYSTSDFGTGIYSFNVTATDVYGYESPTKSAPTIYYVDITKPTSGAINTNSTTHLDTAYNESWYKEVIVLIANVVDATNDGNSGITPVEGTNPSVTGMTKPSDTNFPYSSSGEGVGTTYSFLYKVNNTDSDHIGTGTAVSFSVKDKLGNTSAEVTSSFKVDGIAPTINSINVNGESVANNGTVYVNAKDAPILLNASDNLLIQKVQIACNGTDKITKTYTDTTGAATFAYTGESNISLANIVNGSETEKATDLADGNYVLTVTITDLAGNTTTSTVTVVLDNKAPIADIEPDSTSLKQPKTTGTTVARTYTNGLAGDDKVEYSYYGYSNKDVKLVFTVKDDNITTDGIEIKNGSAPVTVTNWTPITGGYQGSYTFTDEGDYSITIKATDKTTKSTENGADQTVKFRIDKTKPVITATLDGGSTLSKTSQNDVIIGCSVSDASLDSKDVVITGKRISPDGNSTENIKLSYNYSSGKFDDIKFTEEGTYNLKITAVDLAGMSNDSSAISFIIDKTNPDIDVKVDTTATKNKFTSEYKHTGTHYNTNYTYSQFFNKDVELTLKVFDYNKDTITVTDNGEKIGASFTGSNGEYTAKIKVSEEGKHKIVVEATDTAGRQGTSTPVEFAIDKTNPTLDLTLNGEPDPDDMLRVDGDVSIGYKLTDTNKDSTDVKITYVFTPAGGSKKDAVTEELYDDAKKTFKENGTYEVKITAIDKAGNSSSDSASFVIDKQKPELDLKITTSKPAKFDKYKRTYKPAVENYFTTAKDGYEYGQYYKDNVKVKISVFDYDVKGTVVYDNEDEVEVSFKYEGDGLYTGEFTISEEGSHVIKAESVDKSGNTGKSSELSFIIDKTAPALTTTLDGETYSGTDRFCASDAVVGLKIDDKNQDAADVFRSYVITPSDHSAEKTDSSYVTALQETYKQNAYYTVTYTVVDRAGNSSTAKIGFTIDTTKPQSDIKITTKAPAKIDKYHNEYSNTNGHFNTAYTYGQYYNESVSMDMAVFDYNVAEIIVTDNDEAIPVTFASKGDERVASSVTVSSEGEHVVKIIVKDKSGNEATSKSVSFIIDKSEPGLSATLNNSSSITEQYLQGDASVYLSVSDTNEDEDDVTRIVKMTRPSASAETSEETGALEGNVSYSTEADYEITYTAIDRAGNKSDPITLTFRVDKTAPQLSFSGITRDATAAEDTTITYNMLEDFYWDMTSATVKIYQKVDGMGETPIRTVEITASGASTALSETFKEDGQYRFEFTAQDKAGNQATESFTFILDENAPVIILSGVDGYLTDQDVNFGVQVDETFYLGNNVKIEGTVKTLDDPKGVKINFDDYSRLTRMASANFEQLFTEDGIYNIKVTSKDVAGNETVQSIQFTIDKSKPLIKDLENLADEEDYQAYSDAVAANDKNAKKLIPIFNEFNFDYDADDIVTDLTTVTYKMYMDGVLYDGLSEIEDGFHTLKITAEDEVGNTAEKSFYFILDTVKPGIIVTGVEEGDNLQEPTTITVSLQLTEDTLKAVNLNGEAIAITNNTATLEVSDKGDYVLVIEAGDDAGNLATLTIKFEYGKTSSMLWLLIAGGAALLIAAATFFIILGKKRKKNDK